MDAKLIHILTQHIKSYPSKIPLTKFMIDDATASSNTIAESDTCLN